MRLPLERLACRPGYVWYVVGTVCVGAFMAALDASIVNVALPTMMRQLEARYGTIEWVLIAYLLTLAALLPLIGRAADIVGRRPLYILGFVVFALGSAACGAAPTVPVLLAARVFQAMGAAMLQANSVALITATVPESVRGRALGFQGAAQAVGLSVGPAAGGALIGWLGWRAIFFVNLPVGVSGTLLAAAILPADRPANRRAAFDWPGSALLAPALVGLMLALSEGDRWGWGSARVLGALAVALLCGAVFLWLERRAPAPLVDLRLFARPPFAIGNVTGLLSYLVMFGVLFLMPFYFEHVLHDSAPLTGVLLTPVPLGMTVAAPVAGALADRMGARALTTAGMGVSSLGILILVLTLGTRPPTAALIAGLALVGLGLGAFTPPNNSSVMGAVPRTHLGVAGGILNMARSLGMATGTALAGAILVAFLPKGASRLARVPATRAGLVGMLVIAAIALALSAARSPAPSDPSGRRGALFEH